MELLDLRIRVPDGRDTSAAAVNSFEDEVRELAKKQFGAGIILNLTREPSIDNMPAPAYVKEAEDETARWMAKLGITIEIPLDQLKLSAACQGELVMSTKVKPSSTGITEEGRFLAIHLTHPVKVVGGAFQTLFHAIDGSVDVPKGLDDCWFSKVVADGSLFTYSAFFKVNIRVVAPRESPPGGVNG